MNNIKKIQEKLIEKNLDAVLVTDEKNQRYATGFPFTDGAVIVARSAAWLITDSRYIEAATNTAACCCNVQMFDREHSRLSLIQAALKEAGVERLGAEEEKLSHAEYLGYEKSLGMELLPAQAIFSELRASKSEEEIGYLREAQAISEKALAEVLRIIKPGMTERQVAAELVYHMLLNGSEGNSFDPIVITGKKTSMPHGVPGDEVIHEGDFVTMDFGCLKHGYCSDMTRTVGFGHSLGLDIHELPGANLSGKAIMPVGCAVSAEPGIYIPGKFGVRIEDVMILHENGAEVITKAPKQLTIL